jgi:hypothetical protein
VTPEDRGIRLLRYTGWAFVAGMFALAAGFEYLARVG